MTTTTSKASLPLPELKTGDTLVGRGGYEYIVHRVTGKRKHEAEFIEPLYQLHRTIRLNGIYTLDKLVELGLTLKETP